MTEWAKNEAPQKYVIDDNYSTPTYSALNLCQTILALSLEKLQIPYIYHPGLVSYAFKRESQNCVHVSFITTRTTPIDLPLSIPSKHESERLNNFMEFAFSRLRFYGSALSSTRNEYDIHHKDVFISIGYMQISSSLTAKHIAATDKVQGCVLDYICDSSLQRDFIIDELKETQETYRKIAMIATSQGDVG